MVEKVAYTVQEVAELLQIGKIKAYELCASEGFPALKVGRRILIPCKRFEEWLDRAAEDRLAL